MKKVILVVALAAVLVSGFAVGSHQADPGGGRGINSVSGQQL